MEQEIASRYPEIEEFDKSDISSYLRYQYGIYKSFGMSYEEFWEKDYLLVESYVQANDLMIERETANNWELVSYIRGAMLEVASNIYKDSKKGGKPYKFPEKPFNRTQVGQLREERNKNISFEIKQYYQAKQQEAQDRLKKRKENEKSNGND